MADSWSPTVRTWRALPSDLAPISSIGRPGLARRGPRGCTSTAFRLQPAQRTSPYIDRAAKCCSAIAAARPVGCHHQAAVLAWDAPPSLPAASEYALLLLLLLTHASNVPPQGSCAPAAVAPLVVQVTDKCVDNCNATNLNLHVIAFQNIAPLSFGRVDIQYRVVRSLAPLFQPFPSVQLIMLFLWNCYHL
jgi:hypothetical protein